MTDFTLGDTFDIKFTTRQFSTGAPFTLAGTPVVSAYPDNSTTQLTAGITLSVDFDTVTGLNNVRVVATSGNGYASGSSYALVITTGTVDSVSVVGEVIGEFTLGRSAAAVDLANGTDGLGAIKTDTAAILADTGTDGVIVASLGATAKANVNAEVVDALATDTYAEPAQGAPGATVTLAAKIGFLYKAWRNKTTQTATEYDLYNDDAATVDHKATVSDDGTTFSRTEIASGP